ncbi:MAG: DNA methyltransferase [Dehalococcoidia bacterium]
MPILEPLDNIELKDAIVGVDDNGESYEPGWPKADYIVGNPPFLGGKRVRLELGDEYVSRMFNVWNGRVRRTADIVCYWHEKARTMVEAGQTQRVGLLATQAIRGGANRKTLERIKESGDIFFAESDRPWVLEGAAVHISMVGFDDGSETRRVLDGKPVKAINADLTGTSLDLTKAHRLRENKNICFQGPVIVGSFGVPPDVAAEMIRQPNPHGRSNADVVSPLLNASDLTGRARGWSIVDFGQMDEKDAALYEAPFEHVKRVVKPLRDRNRDSQRRRFWWRHGRAGSDVKAASAGKARLLLTPNVSKHRFFVWANGSVVATNAIAIFALDDDYSFGVLHEPMSFGRCGWGHNWRTDLATPLPQVSRPFPSQGQPQGKPMQFQQPQGNWTS